MHVKLITLRYIASLGGFDERPLEAFLADKALLAVREHFFVIHDQPHLACLITYQVREAPLPASDGDTAIDTNVRAAPSIARLSPPEQALFATLRQWRSTRARRDGVPPYVILTNRELIAVVRARPATPTALQAIEGIGPGKVKRYAADILMRLQGEPVSHAAVVAAPAAAEATPSAGEPRP